MTCDVYESKRVKTRKPHVCDYCYADIGVGSAAVCESGLYEGEWFKRYCCLECDEIAAEMWEYCDYECGTIADAMNEFVCDLLCYEDMREKYGIPLDKVQKHAQRLGILLRGIREGGEMSKVYKDEERTIRALCPMCVFDHHCTTECEWCAQYPKDGEPRYYCAVSHRSPLMWGDQE